MPWLVQIGAGAEKEVEMHRERYGGEDTQGAAARLHAAYWHSRAGVSYSH